MEKARKTNEMDMLSGGLAGKLILFAVPLAFSSILQQLFATYNPDIWNHSWSDFDVYWNVIGEGGTGIIGNAGKCIG